MLSGSSGGSSINCNRSSGSGADGGSSSAASGALGARLGRSSTGGMGDSAAGSSSCENTASQLLDAPHLVLALRMTRLLRDTPGGSDDGNLATLAAVLAAAPGGAAASAAAAAAPLLGECEGGDVVCQVAGSALVQQLVGWREEVVGSLVSQIEQ